VLNQMLQGTLKGRLDRFFCRLADFTIQSIEMVGKDPIPGLTYEKPGWGRNPKTKTLPVLPSDHFGLLLKLVRKGR
jgi:tyrosyl-DNA phosphodiesterase 2